MIEKVRVPIVAVMLAIPATVTGVWISSVKGRLAELAATPVEGAASRDAI